MEGKVRRVVTGHDNSGKAIVLSDGWAPTTHSSPLRPGHYSTDIWRTADMPIVIHADEPDPTPGPRRLTPASSGTVIRVSDIPPETEVTHDIDPNHARELFKAMGSENASTFGAGANKRHPFMHRTETLDYAFVLTNEIYLLLDDSEVLLKAGDVVIQRGTNHAWSNRSKDVTRMLYVLMDGKFDPELARQLGALGDGH
ncbi:MAG: cupin domain-containing protein [Betaproteobacteria bacterium]|nr:MAG: cupin domain-containing protein [Betaproteobacteria bacterium]